MFQNEASMAKPVKRWMHSLGLTVKQEFITPWGICDLVGLKFKTTSVKQRIRFGQTKAIGSLTRTALLLSIPDVETGNDITIRSLIRDCAPVIPERIVGDHISRLIADGFLFMPSRDRLQRRNGWAPIHKRFMAVELKRDRVEEAMGQASTI